MGSFSKTIPQTEIFNMEAIIVLIQLLLFGAISPSPMTNGTEPIEATQRPIEIIQQCNPLCIRNTECPINKACVNQKCVNPCPGVCGTNATCSVQNHIPSCKCDPGYTGDPFINCTRNSTCVVNSDFSRHVLTENVRILV